MSVTREDSQTLRSGVALLVETLVITAARLNQSVRGKHEDRRVRKKIDAATYRCDSHSELRAVDLRNVAEQVRCLRGADTAHRTILSRPRHEYSYE